MKVRNIAPVAMRLPGRRPAAWWLLAVQLLLAGPLLLAGTGCHRSFYRQQADVEAYSLVDQKADNPHWALPDYTIQVDPTSRMFDPFNPDKPPMPPDDPTSHQLMHCVDNKRGYPHWHINGDTTQVASPFWMSFLPLSEEGILLLDRDRSVQLALLHAPDYQSELEELYLSALDVSAERFRFDVQLFGPFGLDYQTAGRNNGRPRSRLKVEPLGSTFNPRGIPGSSQFRIQRAFTTGSELAVGIANQLVWDLSGSTTNFTNTLLDFTFIQPLLRDAGRDRVMETLTLSERILLANVRQMERFRRGFYVEITTGSNAGPGPNRAGGFFGQSGLGGFTGVGGGGFGGVGAATGQGGFGGGGGTGAGAAQAGGFIGILQDQQNIRNQVANITGLRENLIGLREVLQENLLQVPTDAGGIPDPRVILQNRLQIAQARQALYNAEGQLLNLQAGYQATLDSFKVTLGLPPELCVKVEDPLLDGFNLIAPEIAPLRDRITDLRAIVGSINEQILAQVKFVQQDGQPVPALEWTEELQTNLTALRDALKGIERVREQMIQRGLPGAREDVEQLEQALPSRRRQLTRLREMYLEQIGTEEFQRQVDCQRTLPADVDPAVFDITRLDRLPERMRADLARLERDLQGYGAPLDKLARTLEDVLSAKTKPDPIELYRQLESGVVLDVPSVLTALGDNVLDTSLVQARARADSLELVDIDLTAEQAFEIASRFRRDWMNQRASLVDQWRRIEFVADDLEGYANVIVAGEILNEGNNPVKLRSTRGHLRFGLQFDAPYTRLQERNLYRQSLIEYQQARRGYYQFVDRVSQGLRGTLRQVELNQLNFEARRVALLASIEQVVLTSEIQTLTEERGQPQSPTAARDIVSALNDFRNAQNDFLSVWVNYEVLRRTLDLDLGTMQLDDRGLWIDPGPIEADHGSRLPYAAEAHPELFLAPLEMHPLVEALDGEPLNAEELPAGEVELPADRDGAPDVLPAPLPEGGNAPGDRGEPPALESPPSPAAGAPPTGARGAFSRRLLKINHEQRPAGKPREHAADQAGTLQPAPLPSLP